MKNLIPIIFVAFLFAHPHEINGQVLSKEEFKEPAIEYWPRPLWFWNNATVTEEGIEEQMHAYRDLCGYGGFGILPFGKDFKPEYLTEDYFKVYGKALEKAKEMGLKMCFYDEYGFPSGGVGLHNGDGIPRFAQQFPDQTLKRLDKWEEIIVGPAIYEAKIPSSGKLMSIVAMETNTLERIDLTNRFSGEHLKWNVPESLSIRFLDWKQRKIMYNICTLIKLCPGSFINFDS